MAYQTGTASSPSDLLNKLITFAVGNGWTDHSVTSGRVISKGTVVLGLLAGSTTLDTRGAITVAGGSAWNAQGGNSGTTHQCDIGAGPYTAYHFYALQEESKDLLAAVVEISSGIFRHWIGCGLIKAGTWVGGTYTDSVNWNDSTLYTNYPDTSYHQYIADTTHSNAPQTGHFWVNSDGGVDTWGRIYDSGDFTLRGGVGCVRGQGKWETMIGIGYQRWNLRTPLWPVELFVTRSSSLRSPLGRVPAMRFVSLRNHTIGEILTIGGSDFQLWPVVARTDTWGSSGSSTPSSGYYGYAYKRT